MTNYIHLLYQSPDASVFLRDFKKFTAGQILRNIKATEPKVIDLFQDYAGMHRFWQKTNMPIKIESQKVFDQKKQYIEYNPVRKGYVYPPEHWRYSSANQHQTLVLSE
jgi:hypothetical protein